ncbi:hypothetical protein [Actinomadura roseirufa]|uniref:hypothetical protein n=1 Tax=Actinomadura roseirufa TaxID=2094049 RepID=UPI001F5EE7AB|nr:hypothetical protein [Actinomadura roseirufa]
MADAAELSARLVAELTEAGDLTPDWRPVFEAVPRHRFVPDTVWVQDGGRLVPVDRVDDEAAWRVLVPWTTDFHNGALVSFVVAENGDMRGRIVGNVAFMRLRDQRGKRASIAHDVHDLAGARRSFTRTHPYGVLGEYDASLAIGLKVPRCKLIVQHDDNGSYTVWLIDPWSDSWAGLDYEPVRRSSRSANRASGTCGRE